MSLSFVRILSQSKPVPSPKRYTPVGISHPLLWSVQSHPAPGLLMSSPPCSSLLLAPGRPLAAAGPSKCGRPELGALGAGNPVSLGGVAIFVTFFYSLSMLIIWIFLDYVVSMCKHTILPPFQIAAHSMREVKPCSHVQQDPEFDHLRPPSKTIQLDLPTLSPAQRKGGCISPRSWLPGWPPKNPKVTTQFTAVNGSGPGLCSLTGTTTATNPAGTWLWQWWICFWHRTHPANSHILHLVCRRRFLDTPTNLVATCSWDKENERPGLKSKRQTPLANSAIMDHNGTWKYKAGSWHETPPSEPPGSASCSCNC